MIMPTKFFLLFLVSVSLSGLVALPVLAGPAAIKCNGSFQVIEGRGEIATPYCEDNHLAQVAREHGINVTDNAIRQNPNLKQDICIVVGSDIRVTQACMGLMPEDDGFRF